MTQEITADMSLKDKQAKIDRAKIILRAQIKNEEKRGNNVSTALLQGSLKRLDSLSNLGQELTPGHVARFMEEIRDDAERDGIDFNSLAANYSSVNSSAYSKVELPSNLKSAPAAATTPTTTPDPTTTPAPAPAASAPAPVPVTPAPVTPAPAPTAYSPVPGLEASDVAVMEELDQEADKRGRVRNAIRKISVPENPNPQAPKNAWWRMKLLVPFMPDASNYRAFVKKHFNPERGGVKNETYIPGMRDYIVSGNLEGLSRNIKSRILQQAGQ